jgi:hypothetical protein
MILQVNTSVPWLSWVMDVDLTMILQVVRHLSLSSFLLPLLISAVDLTLWSYSLSRDISACVWILNLFCSFVILPIASE